MEWFLSPQKTLKMSVENYGRWSVKMKNLFLILGIYGDNKYLKIIIPEAYNNIKLIDWT